MKLYFSILLFSLSFFCFPQQQADTLKPVIHDNTPWRIKPSGGAIAAPMGTYSRKSNVGAYSFDKIKLKKDFQFKRTFTLNNLDQFGLYTISGTWAIKHDTLLLSPALVKPPKGAKYNCADQKNNLEQKTQFCELDTFIVTFKENSLWTIRKEEYKRSTKK